MSEARKIKHANPQGDDGLRLDLWLYRSRLLKTRSAASKIISKGKLRLTRAGRTDRVKKPHYIVRAGDGLSFMRGQTLLSVTVIAMPERRGPAPEARTHYELNTTADSNTMQNVDKSPPSRHIPLAK